MARHKIITLNSLLLLTTLSTIKTSTSQENLYPFTCLAKIQSCNALLYQHNGFSREQVASSYSVNASQIKTILYANRQDYLVPVNCSCKNVNGTVGYFYDVAYTTRPNDTFYDVSNQNFSGQVLDKGVVTDFIAGENTTLHILCGCVDDESQIVVTYSVQDHDTVSSIGVLLSAEVDGIEDLNTNLAPNPSYIESGWVLYVPMEKNGIPPPKSELIGSKTPKSTISISLSVFFVMIYLTCFPYNSMFS